MLRAFLASLASAAVLFAWGFGFWMLSPVPKMMVKPVPNEAGLSSALRTYLPEDGHYFVPFGCEVMQSGDEEAKKKFQERIEDGPLAQVVFRAKGCSCMGASMAMGFGQVFACSLLAAGLLGMARIRAFAARWLFVALLGVFASGAVTLSQPIWFMESWKFSLLYAGFDVAGWTLAGLVLAALLAPKE